MNPIVEKLDYLYKYRLGKSDGDLVYHTGRHFSDDEWPEGEGEEIFFSCDQLIPRLKISKNGVITVLVGYSWDGCSPKFKLGAFIVGVPDGVSDLVTRKPKTFRGSAVHDALCQFQHNPRMPYSRKQIDQIFHEILRADKWEHADAYYFAVRMFAFVRRLK